ncbi:MAG: 50S ribosomal protein L19 [Patescibacteria group bacterium]
MSEEAKTAISNKNFTAIKSGQLVRVHQKIKELNAKGEEKERIQVFEGMVIGRRGGTGMGATITVRKISDGIGVEKIFPLHLPTINNIEVIKEYKVNRAQLPYLRSYSKKLKEKVAKA